MKEQPASLDPLARSVFTRRQELTAMVTEVLVQQRHRQALGQKTTACPQCGRWLQAPGLVSRTVETLVGEVSLERPYFYCLECTQGFYPLDDALELSEGRKQWEIQEAGVRLAAQVPFEIAQELFTQLTGLTLSDHTTHEVLGEVGQGLGVLEVSPTAEEISQRVAEVAQGKKQPLFWCWPLMGPMSPPGRKRSEGGAKARNGSGPRGRGKGRRPRGSGSIWWIRSGLSRC